MASNGAPPPDVDELRAGDDSPGRCSPPWTRKAWVGRLAGALVFVGLAALVGPDLLTAGPGERPAAQRSAPPQRSAAPAPVPQLAPLLWAPRGAAVGSPFAVDAMTRARATHPEVDRLLWAGSVDGRDRVAVFSLGPDSRTPAARGAALATLRVPMGRRVRDAQLQPMGSVLGPDGRAAAAWVGAGGRTWLLVVGRPGPMTVDVSGVIRYRPDGSIGRRWRPLGSRDGVVVVDLGRTDPLLVVRPFRRTPGANFLVEVRGAARRHDPDGLLIGGLTEPTYAGPPAHVLRSDVADAVGTLVDVRRTTARVVWSGLIDAVAPGPGRVRLSGRGALVWLRRDDGPEFQAFVFTDSANRLNSFSANPVPWGKGDRLPYVFSTYDPGTPLLVVNPGRAGRVTVRRPWGTTSEVPTGRDGLGILEPDASLAHRFGGADVVVRDRRGTVVLRSSLVDVGAVDPYGLYL